MGKKKFVSAGIGLFLTGLTLVGLAAYGQVAVYADLSQAGASSLLWIIFGIFAVGALAIAASVALLVVATVKK